MISEIQVATIGVRDLDRSVDFYARTFGYLASDTIELGGAELEQVWQMPAGMRARCTVMGPAGSTTGLLRLVAFDQPGEQIWGDYSRRQDYGHYALNIRASDIEAALDRIRSGGGRHRSGPNRWSPSPDITAWDSLSYDPDGVLLDVFQLDTTADSPLLSFDRDCSELQTVAMHVSDARGSASFYGALGFVELYDKMVEGMEDFFGLPSGTALHNINLFKPDIPACGRVELAQYVGWPGREQRDRAVPPNLGILSVSLETDDLDTTGARLVELGARPISPPAKVELPPFGAAVVQPFFGPDGEVLEFFQRR